MYKYKYQCSKLKNHNLNQTYEMSSRRGRRPLMAGPLMVPATQAAGAVVRRGFANAVGRYFQRQGAQALKRGAGMALVGGTAAGAGYELAKYGPAWRKDRQAPPSKRQRKSSGPGGPRSGPMKYYSGGETSASEQQIGRYARITLKNLSRSMCTQIYRFQGVNRQNANNGTFTGGEVTTIPAPGFYTLHTTPNAAGLQRFPLHVFDLTSINNTGTPVPHQYLQFDDSGLPSFTDLDGQTSAGAYGAAMTWGMEYSNVNKTNTQQRYITHNWFDIRLNLYGARSQPTFYDVMLVRFTNKTLDPTEFKTNTGLSAEDLIKRRALYQGMVKSLVYNPILPTPRDAMVGLEIVKRQQIQIAAGNNDEADRNPNNHIMKWFVKDGKQRDYNFSSTAQSSDSALNGPAYAAETGVPSELSDSPKHGSRLFLIIRASNTTPVDLVNSNGLNTPSYDMVIRKKVTFDGR